MKLSSELSVKSLFLSSCVVAAVMLLASCSGTGTDSAGDTAGGSTASSASSGAAGGDASGSFKAVSGSSGGAGSGGNAASIAAATAVGSSGAQPSTGDTGSSNDGSSSDKSIELDGFISDSTCGATHAGMLNTGSMGATDKSCVVECIKAGSRYVFIANDSKQIYPLADQTGASKFAGQKVKLSASTHPGAQEMSNVSIHPAN